MTEEEINAAHRQRLEALDAQQVCILTGEDGENADDCTTHEHEKGLSDKVINELAEAHRLDWVEFYGKGKSADILEKLRAIPDDSVDSIEIELEDDGEG